MGDVRRQLQLIRRERRGESDGWKGKREKGGGKGGALYSQAVLPDVEMIKGTK